MYRLVYNWHPCNVFHVHHEKLFLFDYANYMKILYSQGKLEGQLKNNKKN